MRKFPHAPYWNLPHTSQWIRTRKDTCPDDGKDHPIPGCPVDDLCACAADGAVIELLNELHTLNKMLRAALEGDYGATILNQDYFEQLCAILRAEVTKEG